MERGGETAPFLRENVTNLVVKRENEKRDLLSAKREECTTRLAICDEFGILKL